MNYIYLLSEPTNKALSVSKKLDSIKRKMGNRIKAIVDREIKKNVKVELRVQEKASEGTFEEEFEAMGIAGDETCDEVVDKVVNEIGDKVLSKIYEDKKLKQFKKEFKELEKKLEEENAKLNRCKKFLVAVPKKQETEKWLEELMEKKGVRGKIEALMVCSKREDREDVKVRSCFSNDMGVSEMVRRLREQDMVEIPEKVEDSMEFMERFYDRYEELVKGNRFALAVMSCDCYEEENESKGSERNGGSEGKEGRFREYVKEIENAGYLIVGKEYGEFCNIIFGRCGFNEEEKELKEGENGDGMLYWLDVLRNFWDGEFVLR